MQRVGGEGDGRPGRANTGPVSVCWGAVPTCCRVGSVNHRNPLSRSAGGWTSESKVSQWCLPSELRMREVEGEGSVGFSVLRASNFSVWEIHYFLLIKHLTPACIL